MKTWTSHCTHHISSHFLHPCVVAAYLSLTILTLRLIFQTSQRIWSFHLHPLVILGPSYLRVIINCLLDIPGPCSPHRIPLSSTPIEFSAHYKGWHNDTSLKLELKSMFPQLPHFCNSSLPKGVWKWGTLDVSGKPDTSIANGSTFQEWQWTMKLEGWWIDPQPSLLTKSMLKRKWINNLYQFHMLPPSSSST
jgi:hypothetical protein